MHFVNMKSFVADSTEIRLSADYTPAGDMLGSFLDGNFDSIPYHKRNLRNILVPLNTSTCTKIMLRLEKIINAH